jgi:hypothetical protein
MYKAVAPKLDSIIQLFPALEDKIHNLFLNNESFREVCIEHILCTSRILEMKQGGEKDAGLGEYEDLQRELENEMLKFLAE